MTLLAPNVRFQHDDHMLIDLAGGVSQLDMDAAGAVHTEETPKYSKRGRTIFSTAYNNGAVDSQDY